MSRKNITDKQVCKAYDIFDKNTSGEYPYVILSRLTGEPEKSCYSAIERAYDRGYIECGVSLRTGWLTIKGKDLLEE